MTITRVGALTGHTIVLIAGEVIHPHDPLDDSCMSERISRTWPDYPPERLRTGFAEIHYKSAYLKRIDNYLTDTVLKS